MHTQHEIYHCNHFRCTVQWHLPRQHIKKQRHYFANKGLSSQGYGFSSDHIWMWMFDCEESWGLKNGCFWTMVLEKSLESPLDCKEIQPVHPKGDQSWMFIGRSDAEAETPVLGQPHAKSWLIGKDPDAGRDWEQEKGMTEDEMVGWHHQLDGHEFEWTPAVGDGQEGLACCNSWGRKESDTTEGLDWTELMQCHLIRLPCCATITPLHLQNFSPSQTETDPINEWLPNSASLQPLATTILLPISEFWLLGASYKWNRAIFVLLYLAYFTELPWWLRG